MEEHKKNAGQIFLDNLNSNAHEIANYIADNPKKMIQGIGFIMALGLSYKIGQGTELNRIIKLQNTKELTNPYRGFNSKVDISKENAEHFLLNMDQGEQFRYHGKKITLLQRTDDKEPTNQGYTDYFMIGNQINMINTSNLNSKTIDQVFGK